MEDNESKEFFASMDSIKEQCEKKQNEEPNDLTAEKAVEGNTLSVPPTDNQETVDEKSTDEDSTQESIQDDDMLPQETPDVENESPDTEMVVDDEVSGDQTVPEEKVAECENTKAEATYVENTEEEMSLLRERFEAGGNFNSLGAEAPIDQGRPDNGAGDMLIQSFVDAICREGDAVSRNQDVFIAPMQQMFNVPHGREQVQPSHFIGMSPNNGSGEETSMRRSLSMDSLDNEVHYSFLEGEFPPSIAVRPPTPYYIEEDNRSSSPDSNNGRPRQHVVVANIEWHREPLPPFDFVASNTPPHLPMDLSEDFHPEEQPNADTDLPNADTDLNGFTSEETIGDVPEVTDPEFEADFNKPVEDVKEHDFESRPYRETPFGFTFAPPILTQRSELEEQFIRACNEDVGGGYDVFADFGHYRTPKGSIGEADTRDSYYSTNELSTTDYDHLMKEKGTTEEQNIQLIPHDCDGQDRHVNIEDFAESKEEGEVEKEDDVEKVTGVSDINPDDDKSENADEAFNSEAPFGEAVGDFKVDIHDETVSDEDAKHLPDVVTEHSPKEEKDEKAETKEKAEEPEDAPFHGPPSAQLLFCQYHIHEMPPGIVPEDGMRVRKFSQPETVIREVKKAFKVEKANLTEHFDEDGNSKIIDGTDTAVEADMERDDNNVISNDRKETANKPKAQLAHFRGRSMSITQNFTNGEEAVARNVTPDEEEIILLESSTQECPQSASLLCGMKKRENPDRNKNKDNTAGGEKTGCMSCSIM